jgi:hypothetical protein
MDKIHIGACIAPTAAVAVREAATLAMANDELGIAPLLGLPVPMATLSVDRPGRDAAEVSRIW